MLAKFVKTARVSAGLAMLIGLLALSACSVGVGVGVHPYHHHYHDRYYD
jgi:hypothetical protein